MESAGSWGSEGRSWLGRMVINKGFGRAEERSGGPQPLFRDPRRSLRRRSDRNIQRGRSTRSPVLRSCTAAGVKGGGDPVLTTSLPDL